MGTKATTVDQASYEVTSVANYFNEYKDKHRIILDLVRRNGGNTTAQRNAMYDSEMNKLKNTFRASRKAEFESKSIELRVGHSCTSKTSGEVRDCGEKSVKAPISDLYTKKEWCKIKGDSKGYRVSASGDEAFIRMTVAGKGRNAGNLFANFKFHPDAIQKNVEQDLNIILQFLAQVRILAT